MKGGGGAYLLITAQTNYFPLPLCLGQTARLGRGGRSGGREGRKERSRGLIERRRERWRDEGVRGRNKKRR